MLRILLPASAILASLAAPRAAAAQSCHPAGPAPEQARDVGLRVDLTLERAAVDTGAVRGGWEGAHLGVAWWTRRFAVRGELPLYRLDDGMDTTTGLGDVRLDGQVALVRWADSAAGLAIALGLPSGDADAGRGMGHVMAMPGAWLAARRGRLDGALTASFGHVLGADDHFVHHRGAVVIDPMSPVEVEVAARAGLRVGRGLTPRAGAAVAVPLLDEQPVRAAGSAGLAWRRDRWLVAADLEIPFTGAAFDARAAVQLARWF